ncbi:MAG: Crp/Fnr family transcriptional regulator [Cytophagales bacterium]|uniref:Crp/Fnr family transcriptional regulator n=1 Tax=Cyclobacterium marinum TaxID=104 RepID=UPI0030DAFAC4|nr:Crp/Fnr family transcriptional regulator [Cytophagales bacterium]|tara:strand:+ start:33894 stop:34466 length:573 start_codon:yes stop_codon:yes gene_type:complete
MTLAEFLNQYKQLSAAEKALLEANTKRVSYKAKSYFVQSGKRSNEVGFITSGIFRYFFYDAEGQEITAHFMAENEFVGNITSFFEFSPSAGSIQAETDCEVIIINREAWSLFCKEIANWEVTVQKIINEVLLRKTNFQRSLINIDAQSAYLNFLHSYPKIAQKAALNHIASYLGITPFSLSRIRKAITSN